MHKFRQWLEKSGVTQSQLARLLGTTRQAVQGWHSGKVVPALYYALAIEAVSGGELPATMWLSQEQRLALTGLSHIAGEVAHGE